MAKAYEVMGMLIPTGGWTTNGEDFDGVRFIEAEPITKTEFEAGFAQYDAWKAKQDNDKAIARAALLAKLGITAEEVALLLS